jgi:hypothetical protein
MKSIWFVIARMYHVETHSYFLVSLSTTSVNSASVHNILVRRLKKYYPGTFYKVVGFEFYPYGELSEVKALFEALAEKYKSGYKIVDFANLLPKPE